MNILLSYSKAHFDPDKKPSEHTYWGSSANILARTLYAQLSKLGTLTYIDQQDYAQVQGQSFDLFVGIYGNFAQIVQSCQIKKSIFFAVNMHPTERRKILLSFMLKERISRAALAGWDLLNEREIKKALSLADHILCVGNAVTYNSYIKNGIAPAKVKVLNYGLLDVKETKLSVSPKNSPKQFVYISSDIGLRKGFDILHRLFTDESLTHEKFHLNIVGRADLPYYQKKLATLKKKLGNKVTIHGWLDSTSPALQKVVSSADFIVYPSLEEGQAGAILDGLSHGTIPLTTPNTGIDFAPLGQFELRSHSPKNRSLLKKALTLSQKEVLDLKKRTKEYYQEYHAGWEASLESTLQDCLNGFTYPKISIVLPIFNKETSIASLLYFLDRACRTYQNSEIIIIFDGCKDKSEAITRDFFKKHPGYPVEYMTTPNIFEIKSNNIGLKKGTGKYGIIIQDDNYIYNPSTFLEGVTFLEKNQRVAILGGLAGVNYFPIHYGSRLPGPGQIANNDHECYWRQDAVTNPEYVNRFFEVDACMRGPLFLRKSFLETHGYLDEVYSPLYQDDMDLAFRARSKGFSVYAAIMDVENKSFTMATYDAKKWEFFDTIMKRNANLFYKRWSPKATPYHAWIQRVPFMSQQSKLAGKAEKNILNKRMELIRLTKRGQSIARRIVAKLRSK